MLKRYVFPGSYVNRAEDLKGNSNTLKNENEIDLAKNSVEFCGGLHKTYTNYNFGVSS